MNMICINEGYSHIISSKLFNVEIFVSCKIIGLIDVIMSGNWKWMFLCFENVIRGAFCNCWQMIKVGDHYEFDDSVTLVIMRNLPDLFL